MRWLGLAAALAGCALDTGGLGPTDAGEAGGDSGTRAVDGGSLDAADRDAARPPGVDAGETPDDDAGPPATGAFGAPTVIYEDPDELVDDPTLTDDLLELYFNRTNDIWVMRRPSVAGAWNTPRVVAELSSTDYDGTPEIHPDGLIIWFASDRPGSMGGADVWESTRRSRSGRWQTPTRVTDLSTASGDAAPAIPRNRLRAVWGNQAPGMDYDLFEAARASPRDPWPARTAVSELNTVSADSNPGYSADGLVLVFDSNRSGALGARDLYLASRPSLSAPFRPATHLIEVSSSSPDEDPWISGDLATLVFASNRSGSWALYEARR